MGFRATLKFRKFKVALNPMYRIFLNFVKSCILSCLSKFYDKEKVHRAVEWPFPEVNNSTRDFSIDTTLILF